ncbi:MAG: 50S ribosomal protein L29 [Anaerolineales bacterium]|jgi:large subunit ribosomal protein L29|nr:MAG: 50S ribosomal protein L29 [Anaerolineales bacterium]
MDADEIRSMDSEDIQDELDDAREELMRLRFQVTTGELTDYNQLRFTRKKIARLLTILRERELEEEMEGEA